jgi:hypothetical protein
VGRRYNSINPVGPGFGFSGKGFRRKRHIGGPAAPRCDSEDVTLLSGCPVHRVFTTGPDGDRFTGSNAFVVNATGERCGQTGCGFEYSRLRGPDRSASGCVFDVEKHRCDHRARTGRTSLPRSVTIRIGTTPQVR